MSALELGTTAARGSFPFLSILTLIFVIAKLFNVIAWSWWLVFLPVWIIPVGLIVLLLIIFLIAGVAAVWAGR